MLLLFLESERKMDDLRNLKKAIRKREEMTREELHILTNNAICSHCGRKIEGIIYGNLLKKPCCSRCVK